VNVGWRSVCDSFSGYVIKFKAVCYLVVGVQLLNGGEYRNVVG
jgi:hypothetical protein